ncbi:hypothetical protein HGP14_14675 [Rhizobium sp. P32RR-XVIII]|uniref:hypothetical protein n=1 Tax=Rhizobium sp. P32RR-XVIII TaxID=2726738 RepID=UPI001456A5FE|nr:hypothetical protein [Rhizobium sp. P32RR-XVIII]NLS04600.1 hypothetical protein [Rhizobium sp. P32RR-XVIII]
METGIRATDGSPWPWTLTPINLTKATFYRTLAKLKARGLVSAVVCGARFTRFEINLDWRPEAGVPSAIDALSFQAEELFA